MKEDNEFSFQYLSSGNSIYTDIYSSSAPEGLRAEKREGTRQETWSYCYTVIDNYESGQALQANREATEPLGVLPLRGKN